jgi:phosphatidylethanolamine-binding protein (PEBP) family uncharacterized protein
MNRYALDRELSPDPGNEKADLLAGMEGHILEQCELTGLFRM